MSGAIYKRVDSVLAVLVLGYFLGIAYFSSVWADTAVMYYALACSIAFSILYIFFHTKKWAAVAALLFIFTFSFALGIFHIDRYTERHATSMLDSVLDTKVHLEGVVVSDADLRDTSQRLIIKTDEGPKVLAVLPRYPEYVYGDILDLKGTLMKPENFETDTGRTFDYINYLKKDHVHYILSFASATQIGEDGASGFISTLYNIKHKIVWMIEKYIVGEEGVFAAGITFGLKAALSQSLKDVFVITGTIHLVALSGYNVTIIARTFQYLFGIFLSKRISALIGAISIVLFVLAVGASSTALRAGLMALIALFAVNTSNMYNVFRSLVVASLVMILINPFTLVYDISFHLSVVATLGIIFIHPLIARKLTFIRSRFWIDTLSTTLAAQIAVLPLILYATGVFSIVSPVVNLLVSPLIPYAMAGAFFTGLGGLVFEPIAFVTGIATYYLNHVILEIIKIFGSLGIAARTVTSFPSFLMWMVYAIMIWILYILHKKYTDRQALENS